MDHIIRAASEIEDVSIEDLVGPRRSRKFAYPRRRCMYLIRRFVGISFPQIGVRFGRDHTTVLYAYSECSSRLREGGDEFARLWLIVRRARRIAQSADWRREEVSWLTRPEPKSLVQSSVRLPAGWGGNRGEMVEDIRDRMDARVPA